MQVYDSKYICQACYATVRVIDQPNHQDAHTDAEETITETDTDTGDARYGIGSRSDYLPFWTVGERRAVDEARKIAAEFVDPSAITQLDKCLQR